MLTKRWIALAGLLSFSALANVSLEEKRQRVEVLSALTANIPAISLESYQRELGYEMNEISLEDRAKIETNILAEKIRTQVKLAYEEALSRSENVDDAVSDVRASIERDLELADGNMQQELKTLALEALAMVQAGGMSAEVQLNNVEKVMLTAVQERSNYLNHEVNFTTAETFSPIANPNKDSDRMEYKSKAEVLSSLVSDRDSSPWQGAASMSLNSGVSKRADARISYQLKINFLGVAIEGGPAISFKREYSTTATILAEGMNPIIGNDGKFEYFRRDRNGQPMMRGGKLVKRYMIFNCDNSLSFETDYSGGGGFSVAGIGGNASVGSRYSNSVQLSSRRVQVPQFVDNRTIDLNFLASMCHNDFMNTRFNSSMTVKQSLNMMMRNVVNSLQFSHPQTKCAVDSQCKNWFRREMQGLVRNTAFPRCVESSPEKFRTCIVKSLRGQKCPIYKNGRRVSSGMFEYPCDNGLRCVQTKQHGWFKDFDIYQNAEGRCQPTNSATYRAPRL